MTLKNIPSNDTILNDQIHTKQNLRKLKNFFSYYKEQKKNFLSIGNVSVK